MAENIQFIYTIVLAFIIFLSLAYSIGYWKKIRENRYFKLFPVYTATSLLVSLTWIFNLPFPGKLFQNIFIGVEFFIFYHFFSKVLTGRKEYFIVGLAILFYISIILVGAFLYNSQTKYVTVISFFKNYVCDEWYVIQNIFIVIPILIYYHSLLNPPYSKNLNADPVFLAMTGIAFCFALSIPLFVFIKMIRHEAKEIFSYLFIINTLAYIVMHLFFIKSYKCIK